MSKPRLFAIISLSIIAVLAVPVILPHVTHPSMIFHISLHVASLTIAVFLSIISVIAYQRAKSTRLLLMTIGFLALGVMETIYLLNASESLAFLAIPVVNIELSHILLLAMLALFGAGVLRVNN